MNNKIKGFTLIEVVVSVTLFAILSFIVTSMVIGILKNPGIQNSALDAIDQARVVTNNFANEIRNATTGNDGSFAINQTGASEIIFYSNYGASGSAVDRIRYYVSEENLYKSVVRPSGSPLSYDLGSEEISLLMSGIENGVDPAFYYYNGNYDGSGTSLTDPVNVNLVKFVEMDLLVKNLNVGSADQTSSVRAGAVIRNLKDNLGN